MTLTPSEFRDLVASTMLSFLREERGEALAVDECIALVNWVDSQDFEFRLEMMRSEW